MDAISSVRLSKGACRAFSSILHNQPCTRADLCASLGVGAATIGKYIEELLSCGMIKEEGYSVSSGGRKPIIYSVSESSRFILCINISTIYCDVAVADFKLNLHTVRHFRIKGDDEPDEVVSRIVKAYESIKNDSGITDESIIGAGVILFGTIKDEHGVMYAPIIQYMNSKWIDYPVLDRLKEKFPFPMFAEKGITATAALEYNYGLGKSLRSMLYVLCAMNIRSAFVVNGEVQGSKSPFFEDAFGHMVVDYNGPLCKCGQYGCINCFSSIPPIVEEYRTRIKITGSDSASDVDSITIEDICRIAEEGNETAMAVISERAGILGIALANYINVTTPDLVLLSGLLIELSQLYFDTAVSSALEHLKKTGTGDIVFKKLGSFSSPLTTSAASLVLDRLF